MANNQESSPSVEQENAALFPEGWRTAYMVILGLLLVVGFGLAALEEFLWHGRIEIVVNILEVAQHGGGIAPVSVLLAVFLTEGWRTMTLLSQRLRNRIRDQGKVEGLKLGISQGHELGHAEASSEWREWFDEHEEARKKGEPFDKPPPDRR